MLRQEYRFQRRGSLRFVYSKGKTVRSGYFSLKFIANPRRQASRAAVVIAKKYAKKAVVRNRIRRRVYEVLRREWDHIVLPADMVITVFDARAAEIPAAELQKVLTTLLLQAHITE